MSDRGPWPVRTLEDGGGRDASARLLDHALLLEHEGGVSVVEFAALAGAEARAGRALLHHATARVLVLESSQAPELVAALADVACTIPEVTANLRTLGALRARPGSDHDRWFGGLLEARRRAHDASSPAARVAAVDATALRVRLDTSIDAMAAARHARSAPDRRAFAEELRDVSARYVHALDALGIASAGVARVEPSLLFARWRDWVHALRHAFTEADAAWEAALPVLADSRGRAGRLWRHVVVRGARKGA